MDKNLQPLLVTPDVLERGVIRDRDAANQVRDFSGLRYGTITPTDLDAIVEFGNRAFILIELKRGQAPLMTGQGLLLERTVQRIRGGGAVAIAIVASHETPLEKDIDVAGAEVRMFFTLSAWEEPVASITVREMLDRFLIENGLGYYVSRQ